MNIRPVPGWEGYFVSECGKVFSNKRLPEGLRRLKGVPHRRTGHWRVKLYRKGSPKGLDFYIHRLVCFVYHGTPPDEEHAMVCHRDDDPNNNHADNLYWGTLVHNTADRDQQWRTLFYHPPTDNVVYENPYIADKMWGF